MGIVSWRFEDDSHRGRFRQEAGDRGETAAGQRQTNGIVHLKASHLDTNLDTVYIYHSTVC